MIEDKEIGLVIAENEEEAFWINARDKTSEAIEALEKELKFHEAVMLMCKDRVKDATKEDNTG